MRRFHALIAVCGLAAPLLLAAPTLSHAVVRKCQAALEKEMGKLEKDMYLRLNKCADTIRKEREKGLTGPSPKGSLTKAAAFCEKMLDKTLDIDRDSGNTSKLDKFFAGVDKAVQTLKCNEQDLDDLGHFVSGANAPGTAFQDFVKEWLAIQAIHSAWGRQVLANDETRTRIQDAIDAPGDLKAAATDCTNGAAPPEPGALWRPNLCAFHKDTPSTDNALDPLAGRLNPVCRLHACRLVPGDGSAATTDDSEANLELAAGTIVGPASGTLMLNVCNMKNLPPPFSLQDYFLLSGTSASGVLKTPLGGAGDVCLRTFRVEGWCDCKPGGSLLPVKDSLACQDHVVDPDDPNGPLTDSDECDLGGGVSGRPAEGTEEECVCAPPSELGCGSINRCDPRTPFERCDRDSGCATPGDLCVARAGGGRCHAGTWNGEQVIRLGGPTSEGDCLVFTTNNLTLVPSGEEGLDGIPCTDDDDVPHGGDGLVPLTTGQATAWMRDGIILSTIAICSAGRIGDLCLEDSNCDTLLDPNGRGDGVCNTTGSSRGQITSATEVGSPVVCADLETSDFSGLRLVGAFPILDGAGLGDLAFTYRFVCQ